jgi:cytoskeletal protein CcmA (bactofilin family)
VHTAEAIVGGRIQGTVIASDRVEVQGGSTVQGDVTTRKLIVQEGGEINGLVRMTETPASADTRPAPVG